MRKMMRVFALVTALLLVFSLTGCGKSTATVGVEEVKAEVRTTTCTQCDGHGVCPRCDGDGFRDGLRCRNCDGARNCPHCSGSGRLEVLEINGKDYLYCPLCHGKGDCDGCDGTGTSAYWGNCIACGGQGYCRFCHGDGVQRLQGF